MIACLAKISPLNTATGTRFDVYLSSVGDKVNGPLVNGLNGVTWEPATITPPSLSMALWNGDFTASVQPGQASLPVNIGTAKKSYPAIDTAAWMGAPIEIYAEEPGTAWPWTRRFAGRITGYEGTFPRLNFTAEVDQQPFAANVLTVAFAGTGGAEGGADLKNQVKPLIFGWAQNVEPVLINAVDSVYQFSGYGAIEGVTKLYERGSDFGSAIGDYADYTALVAATIPAGRWGTCLAAGMVRLGAPAAGVITGDVKGHKVGGSTPRLTGSIINALATIAGVSSGSIETASLTALDSAVPYPINIVLTAQETFLELARRLVLPCNWTAGVSLVGKFFASSISLSGTEVLTFNAQGRAIPQVLTAQEEAVSPPYAKTTMGANRSWRVHSADEISFAATLIERGRYDAGTTYREGNIVDTEDGARWVYINAAATSGNAPPAWPTTSNAWWESLTPPSTGDRVDAELTAPVQTIAAASNGSVSSYAGLGGTFSLKLNNEPVTSGVTYSVVSETGIDVSINASTGAYTVASMSANTGTAVFRASYSGFTWDKTYTVSKVLQGITGSGGAGMPATSIVTSKKAVSIYAFADGNTAAGAFADAVGQLTVFSGNTDVTATASLSATPVGCTGTINTAANTPVSGRPKGYYQITAMSPLLDSATLTLEATYGGITLTEILSISKIKTGYEIIDALPLPTTDLFIGRQVFVESIETMYVYTAAGWSTNVKAEDIIGQLQSGQIADGALTLGKFGVVPSNINPDSNIRDLTFWDRDPEWHFEEQPASEFPSGRCWVLADGWYTGTTTKQVITKLVESPPVGEKLRLRATARNDSNRALQVSASFHDKDGVYLGSGGGFISFAASTGVSTKSVLVETPSGAASVKFLSQQESGVAFAGNIKVGSIRMDVATQADLIVNGSVKGQHVEANTLGAEKLTIGNRQVYGQDFHFRYNPTLNRLEWDVGVIFWIGDDGSPLLTVVAAGYATWPGTYVHLVWTREANALTVVNGDWSVGLGINQVEVCVWEGGGVVISRLGNTIIDGGQIYTDTLHANRIKGGTITAAQLAVTELITDTAQIRSLTVDTLHVKNNAITDLFSAFTPGQIVPTPNTWTTIQSYYGVTSQGLPLLITCGWLAEYYSGLYDAAYGSMRLLRDGGVISDFGGFGVSSFISNMTTMQFVDAPAYGSHNYELQAYTIGGTDLVGWKNRNLNIVQLKK